MESGRVHGAAGDGAARRDRGVVVHGHRAASRGVSGPYDATPAVWEDAPGGGLDLPALGGEIEADVCVVGLGGSGLAAVRALTALGTRVVGLDAGEVACGAAGRNGGFLL